MASCCALRLCFLTASRLWVLHRQILHEQQLLHACFSPLVDHAGFKVCFNLLGWSTWKPQLVICLGQWASGTGVLHDSQSEWSSSGTFSKFDSETAWLARPLVKPLVSSSNPTGSAPVVWTQAEVTRPGRPAGGAGAARAMSAQWSSVHCACAACAKLAVAGAARHECCSCAKSQPSLPGVPTACQGCVPSLFEVRLACTSDSSQSWTGSEGQHLLRPFSPPDESSSAVYRGFLVCCSSLLI